MNVSALAFRPWQVLAAAFVGVFVLAFWPTWLWMAERFDAHDSFYSHGWLIPAASGWLIWQRRARLNSGTATDLPRLAGDRWLSPNSSFAGLGLLLPCLAIHLTATWLHIGFVSGFAMVGAVWGLVWTCWGRAALWALRFPMLFLLFMVPLPGVLLIAISFKMKMMAASLATVCLNLLGIAATQAGSSIEVPNMTVIVDDTCSGLRSLISLIALGVLWTSLMGPAARPVHRLAVVAASVPIALVANMVRILVLVLLSLIYGPKIADSFVHYGSGFVVFGVSVAALAWISNLVQRWAPSAARK